MIVIDNHPLASEDQLHEMLQNISSSTLNIKEKPKKETNSSKPLEFDISEQSTYLLKVRVNMEQALSEICEKTGYEGSQQFRNMLNHLGRVGIFSSESIKIATQIWGIANRGIHGEIVSAEYINFVEKAFPAILKELRDSNQGLNYCVCPKCKYQGYALFENVCPRCGFVHDDD